MKTLSSATIAVKENTAWQLYTDLQLGVRYATSWLELKGWLDQGRRACEGGAINQDELDQLLEEAMRIGSALAEI